MVRGLQLFKDFFSGYENQYTVIGGTACDLLLGEAGLPFRATRDLDIVLIVEMLDTAFANRFWDFIRIGNYTRRANSIGEQQFYRFSEPADDSFPMMIELFARKPDYFLANNSSECVPLHISDDVSSLSSILLNDDYYQLLLEGRTLVEGIPVLNTTQLIPFKAKAWLDLTNKKAAGMAIDSKDIAKHKNDVYRLAGLLSTKNNLFLNPIVKQDMHEFLMQIEKLEDEGSPIFKRLTKGAIINLLRDFYVL